MPHPSTNLLIESLSVNSRALLLQHCVQVDLPLRKSLYEPESIPRYAYFLTSGVASVVTAMKDGGTVEVGLIGREGVVGAIHLLGSAPVLTSCFVQSEAAGLRIPFPELLRVFRSDEDIRDRVLQFVQEQALTLSQVAACNRLHEAEERLARWLLMASDRTGSDDIGLTQEFLGMMLGSRRSTVTLIAGILQRSGLIEYHRGRVKILNRESLEAAACDCYKITKELYTSLYEQERVSEEPSSSARAHEEPPPHA